MKLTIIQIDETPAIMRAAFQRYMPQFPDLFNAVDAGFSFERIDILDGDMLPDPVNLEAIIITGSKFGVYENPVWIEPLRAFIRATYAAKTPMLGICFGHQIIADALGGDVRKSQKGWGLGRQVYDVVSAPDYMSDMPQTIALPASHQDQVIRPPASARTFVSSDFCQHAGLIYDTGRIVTLQPHPEFSLPYARGLVEKRRSDPLSDEDTDRISATLERPMDSFAMAKALVRYFEGVVVGEAETASAYGG
jgi:GMP synthase-like glutamine amidotransferase